MRFLIGIALFLSISATPASACSLLSTTTLHSWSDLIVWGTYVGADNDLQGAIKVKRTEKGQRTRSIEVQWQLGSVDEDGVEIYDGVGCPSLPRLIEGDRARFFLKRESDQRYLVVGYDHVRERVER